MESTVPGANGISAEVVELPPTKWWVMALLGVLSIAAGVLAIAYPGTTLLVLGIVFGINLLMVGVLSVLVAADAAAEGAGGRTLQMIVGFLAVLAGMICLVRPGASVLALLLAVAFCSCRSG